MTCSRAAGVGVDGVEAAAVCRLVLTLDIVLYWSGSLQLNDTKCSKMLWCKQQCCIELDSRKRLMWRFLRSCFAAGKICWLGTKASINRTSWLQDDAIEISGYGNEMEASKYNVGRGRRMDCLERNTRGWAGWAKWVESQEPDSLSQVCWKICPCPSLSNMHASHQDNG